MQQRYESCTADGNKEVSYVETFWKQQGDSWKLQPLVLNGKETICVTAIVKKIGDESLNPSNFRFGGRIKNGTITVYKDADEFSKEDKKFTDYFSAYVFLQGLQIVYYVALAFLLIIVLFYLYGEAGYIPTLSARQLTINLALILTSLGSSEVIMYYAYSYHSGEGSIFNPIFLLLFVAVLLFPYVKKKFFT